MTACRLCGQEHSEGPCSFPLPRKLDRYELLSVLGSGGFASVYRARHAVTGATVAVKVLNGRGGSERPDRLVAEARAMSTVVDPHVVRVLDAGLSDAGEAFVVMELAQGMTLQDLLERGPVAMPRAVEIAAQMLDGLEAVHAKGIVHRDVKPENVLVSGGASATGDFVRLLDFGISKVPVTGVATMTLPGTSMGTPGYMAPELFGDSAAADARADIYAVAATLYLMLAQRMPFSASSYEDLVVQVRTQRAPALASVAPHVPTPLAEAVDRGLARDRDARWPTAATFAQVLRSSVAGTFVPPTVTPTHYSAPPVARSSIRRGPAWAPWLAGGVVLLGVLALLGTASIYFLSRASSEARPNASASAGPTSTAPVTSATSAAATVTAPSPPTAVASGALPVPKPANTSVDSPPAVTETAWNGTYMLECDSNDQMSVSGVHATMPSGTVISATGNCVLHVRGCTIRGATAIHADNNAHVFVEGGSVDGTSAAVEAGGNAHVEFHGTSVTGKRTHTANGKIIGP